MLKQWLTAYFTFTKKERTGVLILLTLIIIAALLPLCYPLFHHRKVTDDAWLKQAAVALIRQQDSIRSIPGSGYPEHTYRKQKDIAYEANAPRHESFPFDPNTLAPEGWKRLGLRDRTITTIQHYLAKGGHFYVPEDISKIWGLHEDEVQRLLPYVRIAPGNNSVREYDKPGSDNTPGYGKTGYNRPLSIIDINTADTTAWIALPGIGSKLAARIVLFRDKLGGFYSIDQVGDTYGLPDSAFRLIRPRLRLDNSTVKQLNINTAGVDELKKHPLVRYTIANAIVQYRNQHGPFGGVEDLKKIMVITEELFNKVSPYLTVN